MSDSSLDLNQLAYEYDRLEQEADRAWQLHRDAKTAAELAESRKTSARGRLGDALSKAKVCTPCTIAIEGTPRLLTVYNEGCGLGFVVTTNPKPQ